MGNVRIIPRLDIKGPNLVKGVRMEGLRVLGRPELFAPQYYADGADEIIYIDAVASLYGRNNLQEIISRAAEELYIPLTVGGGIRSVDDIRALLRAGADKVAINTALFSNPELVSQGAHAFGSQCIVVSIHAKLREPGRYECLSDYGREKTGVDLFEWVKKVVSLGAGELLITSVDREGTGKGYDLDLISRVSGMVDIPVIASGGAGNAQHILEAVSTGRADAVAVASVLHYRHAEYMAQKGQYAEEGNVSFLKQARTMEGLSRKGITPLSIVEVKQYLSEHGVSCRGAGMK